MKKVVFGGFLFLGGAVMYSVGILGIAHGDVRSYYMQAPKYLGIAVMILGITLGIFGLKSDK